MNEGYFGSTDIKVLVKLNAMLGCQIVISQEPGFIHNFQNKKTPIHK